MNASVAVSEQCGSVMMRVSKQRTGGVFCPSKWSAAVSQAADRGRLLPVQVVGCGFPSITSHHENLHMQVIASCPRCRSFCDPTELGPQQRTGGGDLRRSRLLSTASVMHTKTNRPWFLLGPHQGLMKRWTSSRRNPSLHRLQKLLL